MASATIQLRVTRSLSTKRPRPSSTPVPQSRAQLRGPKKRRASDLWVYNHLDGRTTDASLEGIDIAAWLREHGHRALAEAMQLPSDVEAAMHSLAAGLEAMLSEAEQV